MNTFIELHDLNNDSVCINSQNIVFFEATSNNRVVIYFNSQEHDNPLIRTYMESYEELKELLSID